MCVCSCVRRGGVERCVPRLRHRVAQKQQAKEAVADTLYEMSKPLARYRDDEDLERLQREQEREGDPMLAYLRKKKAKQRARQGKKGAETHSSIHLWGTLLP